MFLFGKEVNIVKTTFKKITSTLCAIIIVTTMLMSTLVSASALSYSGSSSYKSGKYYTALTKVNLTGNQRTDIVNVAKSQIGYHESSSSSKLSGEGSGSGNCTEYGRWYGSQDMWCAMFVSWCANTAGISKSIVPSHSYTPTGLSWFKNKGQAYSRQQVANGKYTPQAGDIIYFKSARNNNETNHVGIVTKYSGGKVYTIEGNSNNSVETHSYAISNTYIVYICKPSYKTNATVTLNKSSLKLVVGKSSTLKATTTGSKISSWTSSNKSVATVTSAGKVTAIAPGTATITVKLANGSKDTCKVTVTKVSYFSKCSSSKTSIVDALKSIGVDSSITYRKKIASANGISNYTGTSSQNTALLNLLKKGKLIKP